MVETLILLLGFQLAGELIARGLHLPIPGAVLGMLLLFLWLCFRRSIPVLLGENVPNMMRHLGLFFVPAGVGVLQYADLLGRSFIPLTVTLVLALLVTHLSSAWILKTLLVRSRARRMQGSRRGNI